MAAVYETIFYQLARQRLARARPQLSNRSFILLCGAPRRDDLIGRATGQLRHVIKLESERADPRRAGADLDNQIPDFGLRHLRPYRVPSGPAFTGVESQNLPSASRKDGVHFRSRFARADDLDLVDGFK